MIRRKGVLKRTCAILLATSLIISGGGYKRSALVHAEEDEEILTVAEEEITEAETEATTEEVTAAEETTTEEVTTEEKTSTEEESTEEEETEAEEETTEEVTEENEETIEEETTEEETSTEEESTEEEETETEEETTEEEETEEELTYVEVESVPGVIQSGSLTAPESSSKLRAARSVSSTYYSVIEYIYGEISYDGSTTTQTIDVSDYSLSTSDLQSVFSGLLNEHPELYYVKNKYSASVSSSSSVATTIILSYNTGYDDSKFQSAVSDALSVVDDSMSDVEKALALHEYLLLNCEYDTSLSCYSAYDALVDKTAVCEGYALAYKYLLNQVGITCYMVTSDSMNHAWNMLYIDGEYYEVDVTWDDPTSDLYGRARHDYFLLSDDTLEEKDHYEWTVQQYGEALSVTATDTTYEDAFWVDTARGVWYSDGYWYYIYWDYDDTLDNKIVKYNFANKSSEELYSFSATWPVWGSENQGTIGLYTGLALYDGDLYFNTYEEIQKLSITDGTVSTVYTPDTSEGYIYMSYVDDGILYYIIGQSSSDVTTSAYTSISLSDISEEDGEEEESSEEESSTEEESSEAESSSEEESSEAESSTEEESSEVESSSEEESSEAESSSEEESSEAESSTEEESSEVESSSEEESSEVESSSEEESSEAESSTEEESSEVESSSEEESSEVESSEEKESSEAESSTEEESSSEEESSEKEESSEVESSTKEESSEVESSEEGESSSEEESSTEEESSEVKSSTEEESATEESSEATSSVSSDDDSSSSSDSSSTSSVTVSEAATTTYASEASLAVARAGSVVAEKTVPVTILSESGTVTATTLDAVISTVKEVIATASATVEQVVLTVQTLMTTAPTEFFSRTVEVLASIKGSEMVVNDCGTIKTAATAVDVYGNNIASAGVVENVTTGSLVMLMGVNADGTVEYVEGVVDPVTGAVMGIFENIPVTITVLVLA